MAIVQLIFRSEKTTFFDARTFERESTQFGSRNDTLGITGILVSLENVFIGVLEGRERSLFALMEKIVSDKRHKQMVVLFEEVTDQPRFASWHYGAIFGSGRGSGTSMFGELLAEQLRASRQFTGVSEAQILTK